VTSKEKVEVDMSGPLEGFTVVELCTTLSGPYCTQILADFGAEVIKVEYSSGDVTRSYGPSRSVEMGPVFLTVNRGKRSVVLDLKEPEGYSAMRRLLTRSDALVHNLRPAAIDRLGLAYSRVAPDAPDLIYCAIVGFGAGGRYQDRAAYDDVIQGMSGLAHLQGVAAGDGAPHYVATAMIDKTVGLVAASALLAALLRRTAGGSGQYIEVPMYEVAVAFLLTEHLAGRAYDPALGAAGYRRILSPHRRPYQTKDGYISVVVYTESHWRSFLSYIGMEHILGYPRFRSNSARAANIDELYAIVADAMGTRTTEEWITALLELDVPAGPILTLEELFDDGHLKDVGMFERYVHPTEGSLIGVRSPVRFSQSPVRRLSETRPAPGLGEHTDEILGRRASWSGEGIGDA
jgi:crotonobetainyl-CoA:carnitine CoA-transferase CaiB-like acyl-CoA transferase